MAMMVVGTLRCPPQNRPPAISAADDPKARRTFGISTNPFPGAIVTQLSASTYLDTNENAKP